MVAADLIDEFPRGGCVAVRGRRECLGQQRPAPQTPDSSVDDSEDVALSDRSRVTRRDQRVVVEPRHQRVERPAGVAARVEWIARRGGTARKGGCIRTNASGWLIHSHRRDILPARCDYTPAPPNPTIRRTHSISTTTKLFTSIEIRPGSSTSRPQAACLAGRPRGRQRGDHTSCARYPLHPPHQSRRRPRVDLCPFPFGLTRRPLCHTESRRGAECCRRRVCRAATGGCGRRG